MKPKKGVPGRQPFLPRDPVDGAPGVIVQSLILNVKNTKPINILLCKKDTYIYTSLLFAKLHKINFVFNIFCLNFSFTMNSLIQIIIINPNIVILK